MALAPLVASAKVVIISWVKCPFCVKAKALLQPMVAEADYKAYDVDTMDNGEAIRAEIKQHYNHETVPAVFIKGEFVGGFSEVDALNSSGKLKDMLA